MFKNDSSTEDQCTLRGLSTRQNFFSEIRGTSRNQYDCLDKFEDNEVKTSTPYLPRTYYSSQSKNDFKIGTCNHFQDLHEKFQELESKMFEVEKCFKEANKREMDDVHRLMDNKCPSESVRDIPKPRQFEVAESRKEASDGIKEWLGNYHSIVTEKKAYESQIVRDGSGDTPKLPNEASSQDSCKTMIKSNEKPPAYLLNRHGTKGIFTIKQFEDQHQQESPKQYISEVNDRSTRQPLHDVDFLEKSKKLILTLIDKELKRIETKSNQFSSTDVNRMTKQMDDQRDTNRSLKIQCINNIERELNTLKKLESSEP